MITYNDPSVTYNSPDFLWNGEETPDVLLRIGGRDLEYVGGSLRVKHSFDRRCTARFSVESDTSLDFKEGELVSLRLNKKKAFTGLLFKPEERWPGHTSRLYKLEGVCFHHLAQQRIYTASFQDTLAGDIVKTIVAFLDGEGLAQGAIADGPVVTEAVFSYVSVEKALDKLAEIADFHWHIDDLRRLHFGPIQLFQAPFDLTEIDEHADKASASRGNRDYRNVQYLRGGKAETTPRNEKWVADGEQKTFVTGFPIAKQPVIKVDSVVQTIDVKGFGDPDAQWFWARGSPEVTQNEADPALSAGSIVELDYIGLFDLVVISANQGEIDRRAAAQGFGTGQVESSDTDPTVTNADAAFQVAGGKLARFGVEGKTLNWTTELQEGLEAGQSILVDIPDRDFNAVTMFIPEISVEDRGSRVLKTVRAVEGPDDDDWATWFGRKLTPFDPVAFRENIEEQEVLIILASSQENWEWDEEITTTVRDCFVADGSYVLPTSTEIYNDATITYGDPSVAYYGDGVNNLQEAC